MRGVSECYTAAEQDNKSTVRNGFSAPSYILFSSYD